MKKCYYVISIALFISLIMSNTAFTTMNQEELIKAGEKIFFNETFKGNGRTCGTCHPSENNFTIDPKFIATLPQSNPLFVAENKPALAGLEKPVLMRQFGLILENLDGFDQPGVLRGVPHVLALRTTITIDAANEAEFGLTNATGWSTDGSPNDSPNDGSLRSFAVGAVRQHFTKRLNRVQGVDFRLPTPFELDALEAFMLSLGRQEIPDLNTLHFKNAIVENGKGLFNQQNEAGKCIRCHQGAGANNAANESNVTANTNVEDLPDQPARLIDPSIPRDGGLGRLPLDDGHGGIGNGKFNSVPLIEAADTPPFFHNNSINTIEAAVAFFNSDAFNVPRAPAAQIRLEPTQVVEIAAFLRAMNTLENIRNSNEIETKILEIDKHDCDDHDHHGHDCDDHDCDDIADRRLRSARSETEDAIEVLLGGVYRLYENAIVLLQKALKLEDEAIDTNSRPKRDKLLREAIALKNQATELIVEED